MFVNKLKMNSIAEAVKQVTEKEDSCKDEVKKHEKRLHGKDGEVSQHVDKMHKEESELAEAEKVMTPTGMKVYGSSYGDSAKARRDQVKKEIDTLKGPKAKDMMQKDKEDHMKTKGKYDEAARDIEFKNKLIEALKGKQHKIDKNKNNKIDAQDFAILRGQQKEEVELTEGIEVKKEYDDKKEAEHGVYHNGKKIGYVVHDKKNDIHTAYHNPTSHDDHGHADDYGQIDDFHKHHHAISQIKASAGLNEEASSLKEEVNEREMTDAEMAKREKIVKGMKKSLAGFKSRYGDRAKSVMYATANKQAMKEDSVEEEIDPKVRTKDTLKGQEVTAQSDDVGPNSNGRSTKVKFRGGPMKEGVELDEATPPKNTDIADKSYLKDMGKKPTVKSDLKNFKNFLTGKKETNEGKQPESDTVPFITNAEQPPFDGPYTKTPSNVKDKSGAVHTPMSRAKDLARAAMKRIKTEMLGKAPGNNG